MAIELAAARTRILPPSALLGRLEQALTFLVGGARDMPERQKALRQAISWSHDLLTGDELGAPWTQASDVYSLGVILFELLTGRLPFKLGRA